MGTEAEKKVIDERAIFRVQAAGGFATGIKKYEPGEDVVWAVPEGWNEAKNGKHFASFGPSVTFMPMNEAAEKIMLDHKKKLEERSRPKPSQSDERANRLEDLVVKMLNAQGEAQSESRRAQERHEQLMERLIAAQEKKK